MGIGLIASANVADHLGSVRAIVSETEGSGGSGRASRASLQAWGVIADSLDCGDYYLVIEIPDSVKYRKGTSVKYEEGFFQSYTFNFWIPMTVHVGSMCHPLIDVKESDTVIRQFNLDDKMKSVSLIRDGLYYRRDYCSKYSLEIVYTDIHPKDRKLIDDIVDNMRVVEKSSK